jgi:hypothetical protein
MLVAAARLTAWRARARLWLWGAAQLILHGRPRIVFAHYGGIGDALMMARVLHEWRRRHKTQTCVWILTEYPSIFDHNPDCDHALRFSTDASRMFDRLGARICWLHYTSHDAVSDRDQPPDGHLIAAMCRLAGVRGRIELTPRIVLTPKELAAGRVAGGAICVQSTTSNARFPIATKEWGSENFAVVVQELRAKGHRVIQLGSANDAPLPGAEDWRGKTTIRQTAALLAASRLFVGLVGGLMHLARAVECPAVVVYGGRELPEQSGYSSNTNITRQPACSPCWLWSRCEHDFVCLREIHPNEVFSAIARVLASPRRSVPADHVILAECEPAL